MKKLKNTGAYAYLFPSFLIFGIFLFYPFFKTLYLSLFKTNKMGQAKLFVGLGSQYDTVTYNSSPLQQNIPGNPFFQYCICTANGNRIQFSSNDFQDHASSIRRNHQ